MNPDPNIPPRRPSARRALAALLLAGSAVAAAGCSEPEAEAPPHILLIVADDLGWGDVGFHGSEIRTPRLDRLAQESLELSHVYSFPLCSSSRAALLTGRSPFRQGLAYSIIRPWSSAALPLEEELLPEALAAAGYRTALIGKWHLGHTAPEMVPNARGFEHFYGFLNGAIDYFEHTRDGGLDWQRNGRSIREPGYATDLLAREAVRTLKRHDPSEPLFLCLSWNAPHIPLQVPEPQVRPYASLPEQRRIFAGMVAALDEGVGDVLDALEERGMAENTIVLFVGDNGADPGEGGSNQPLRGGKGTTWEGGIRVPALLRWPGRVPAGGRSEVLVSFLDLAPTLCAAAGVAPPDALPLDGHDRWPALTGGDAPAPHAPVVIGCEDMHALRYAVLAEPWKLVLERPAGRADRVHLYRFREDPREANDLAEDHPDVVARLGGLVSWWDGRTPPDSVRYAAEPPAGWSAPRDWAAAALEGE